MVFLVTITSTMKMNGKEVPPEAVQLILRMMAQIKDMRDYILTPPQGPVWANKEYFKC